MRDVEIGFKKYTKVVCSDEPAIGNKASHEYQILSKDGEECYGTVTFQNGPVKEFGVNGCHNEDMIAIVIDRLEGFQSGEFRCRENAIAITKLEEALLWLNKRTNDRIARGVEGKNIV